MYIIVYYIYTYDICVYRSITVYIYIYIYLCVCPCTYMMSVSLRIYDEMSVNRDAYVLRIRSCCRPLAVF